MPFTSPREDEDEQRTTSWFAFAIAAMVIIGILAATHCFGLVK